MARAQSLAPLALLLCALPAASGMARPTSATAGLAPSWRADRPRQRLMDIPKRTRKKLTFIHGAHTIHLVKKENECVNHILMKALVWATHVDAYSGLEIERVLIGNRYTPDVVSLDETSGEVVFWGECGRVELEKIASIVERFQRARFVFAKWSINPLGFAGQVSRLIAEGRPAGADAEAALGHARGSVDVVSVPADSEERFFSQRKGADASTWVVAVDRADLNWVRVWPSAAAD
ncbi:hypothetical protein T492DRAFT_1087071 [Pavlovales sp. CCMP2436]|nr:hypothetical protein T492DRAFT_1087071 [Pavlovales sp. CCMP2436]|mmetsp:Transcript_16137/g.37356  ORF Transcript_16137/g.37356 Transcript_16137/m.37356 type:complete len:235 (-) Transcript_16137:69-773(-)